MAGKGVKLTSLKVNQLKQELEERELETNGVKSILQDRLREALLAEGQDPDTFLFETDSGALVSTLESKMEENKTSLESKFQLVESKMEENKTSLESKFQLVESKMEENKTSLESKFQLVESKMEENKTSLESKFQLVESKMEENKTSLESKMEENKSALTNLESKIEENKTSLESKFESLKETFERKLQENSKILEDKFEIKLKIMEDKFDKKIKELQNNNTSGARATLEVDDNAYLIEKDTSVNNCNVPITMTNYHGGLPTFDGKTPWEDYRTLLDVYADIYGWTPAAKADNLCLSLRGDALSVLQTIPKSDRGNIGELLKHMEMRFGHRHMYQLHRSELRNRIQKPNESLQEFEADIARLVRIAYPASWDDEMKEIIAVDRFLDGLREPETQQAVKLARPQTLSEALTQALEFEAVTQSVRSRACVHSVSGEDSHEELVEEITKRIFEKFMTAKKGIRCWGCGKRGHLRNKCPKKSMSDKKQEGKEAVANRITVATGKPVEDLEQEEYTSKLRKQMDEIHATVRTNIQGTSDTMKQRYDIKANHGGYQAGDMVWLYNPQRRRGYSPKLQTSWDGPYEVVTRINDVVYRIKKPRGTPRIVHFNRLAPYHGDNAARGVQEVKALHPAISDFERFMANLGMSLEEGNVAISHRDLFTLPKSYALAHCIARNVGASRGIATVFRTKFGRLDELNLQNPAVGKALHLQDQNQHLFYLVTKDQPQQESTYQALWQSLMHLRTHLQFLGVKQLGIPRLGCGYDRLDWNIVRPMIGRIFKDTGINVTCCVFNPWAVTQVDPLVPASTVCTSRMDLDCSGTEQF